MNVTAIKLGGAGALLIGMCGLQAVGCSSELDVSGRSKSSAEGQSGSVSLNLVPVSGVTINSVNYVVTGTPAIPGTPLPSGVLPTPGSSKDFTFGIPVPVGTGYTLSLTAVSAETGDDITCTGSHGPFDVTPNTSTGFPVTLSCVDNSNGQLVASVDVQTNACPRLIADYVSAIPGKALNGSSLALNALGHDLDGKLVTYAWSVAAADALVGSFTGATTASPTFLCTGIHSNFPVTVTLNNGECMKALQTTITCFDATCGNGILDPGEDCDPAISADQPGGSPAGTTFGCPSNCHATCGNGIVEVPTEQCELNGGPPTIFCTAQCRTCLDCSICGDGVISGFEACDGSTFPPGAPAGACCSADCSTLTVSSCGDGILNACGGSGEECDPNNTATCSNDCQSIVSQACVDCEATSACAPFALACLNSAGTATAADQARCFDVEECIQDTNCADGPSSFSSCFCGTLTTSQCAAAPDSGPGSPSGPCAGPIRAGSGTGATNSQILARFTNRNFASGAGINRFNCLKNNPVCSPLCGF